MTDVSAGFRPPCWCPCRWAPTRRLHTYLYKFGENVSPHIFHKKNCCDLNLGEILCKSTFFLIPDSGLNLLNGFDFLFWSILNGVTLKTSNSISLFFHQDLCKSLFDNISEDKNHRLHHLLPPQFSTTYSLRNPRTFNIKFNTRRANNTFFNAQCHLVNSFKA